jgi:hypothetical protein
MDDESRRLEPLKQRRAAAPLFRVLIFLAALALAAAMSAAPAGAQQNLLVNADFRDPDVPITPDGVVLCGPGYRNLPGWQVTRGSVKVVGPWWLAPGPLHSLDLVGESPGTIEQTFPTEPGQFYRFTGYMSHHPLNPQAPEGRANVSINGAFLTQLVHRDRDSTRSEMHWVRFQLWFRAGTAITTLALADATGTDFAGGLVLASLSVTLASVPDNVLTGGDFESSRAPNDRPFIWATHPFPLDGWGQFLGNAALATPRAWQQIQGNRSLALAAPTQPPVGFRKSPTGPGTVWHGLVTEPGRLYTLRGWMAHDPSVSEGRAYVLVSGDVVGQLVHGNDLYGVATPDEMRWQRFALRFRARQWVSRLTLTADTQTPPQERGLVLDDLVVAPDPLLEPLPLPSPASGVPAAPVDLTAFTATGPKIDLSWTDRSDNETGFAVWRRTEQGDWTQIATLPPNSASFLDVTVRSGTTYTYRVHAVNDRGASDGSNEVRLFTPETPAAPSNLIARRVTLTQINLFWTSNSLDETGFLIWKRWGVGEEYYPYAVVPARQAWYTDVGREEWELAPCDTYSYAVTAINRAGVSDYSNAAVVEMLPPVPAAPTHLQASFNSGISFRFTWQDNSDNESEFTVWGRKEGGDYKFVTRASPDQTFGYAYDLEPNTTYTFRVRADNLCVSSDWSNEVTVRTRAGR